MLQLSLDCGDKMKATYRNNGFDINALILRQIPRVVCGPREGLRPANGARWGDRAEHPHWGGEPVIHATHYLRRHTHHACGKSHWEARAAAPNPGADCDSDQCPRRVYHPTGHIRCVNPPRLMHRVLPIWRSIPGSTIAADYINARAHARHTTLAPQPRSE